MRSRPEAMVLIILSPCGYDPEFPGRTGRPGIRGFAAKAKSWLQLRLPADTVPDFLGLRVDGDIGHGYGAESPFADEEEGAAESEEEQRWRHDPGDDVEFGEPGSGENCGSVLGLEGGEDHVIGVAVGDGGLEL